MDFNTGNCCCTFIVLLFFSTSFDIVSIICMQHIEVLVSFLRSRHSLTLSAERSALLAPWLGNYLQGKYRSFNAARNKSKLRWDNQLSKETYGSPAEWFEDVDTLFMPMIWGDAHWVGLAINLTNWLVEILDPNVSLYDDRKVEKFIAPIVEMLPYLIKKFCKAPLSQSNGVRPFTWKRLHGVYLNDRSGDCGPVAMKFIELYCNGGGPDEMAQITDYIVDEFRAHYAIDIYKEFVAPLYDSPTTT